MLHTLKDGPGFRRLAATGVSAAFGTFGELLQGVLPEEDGDFLVTLPVARWAMARFRVRPGERRDQGAAAAQAEGAPPHRP